MGNRSKTILNLRKLPLFEGLSEENLAEIASRVTLCHLATNEVLFEQGDPGDSLYIIHLGKVKVYVNNSRGEEVLLNEFGPGESFGELSLVDFQPRSASIAAIEDSQLYELKRADFMEVIRMRPLFALDMIRDVSQKLRFAITYIQKVTEWSQFIAEGNYSKVMDDIQSARALLATNEDTQSDEVRAGAFLFAFFKMVSDVKEREDEMKRKVLQLQIEIDMVKKQEAVTNIVESDSFQRLQKKAKSLRQRHQQRQSDQGEED